MVCGWRHQQHHGEGDQQKTGRVQIIGTTGRSAKDRVKTMASWNPNNA
jgi:hypothetical protein